MPPYCNLPLAGITNLRKLSIELRYDISSFTNLSAKALASGLFQSSATLAFDSASAIPNWGAPLWEIAFEKLCFSLFIWIWPHWAWNFSTSHRRCAWGIHAVSDRRSGKDSKTIFLLPHRINLSSGLDFLALFKDRTILC